MRCGLRALRVGGSEEVHELHQLHQERCEEHGAQIQELERNHEATVATAKRERDAALDACLVSPPLLTWLLLHQIESC